jgi:hypothetical protein
VLTRDGTSDLFKSKPLILVSFAADDEYALNGVKDNQLNDQTFLVKLGDKITATYNNVSAVITVPINYVLTLNINVLQGPKEDAGQVNQVKAAIAQVSAVYAQVGVVVKATVTSVDTPRGIYNQKGQLVYNAIGNLSSETITLLNDQKLRVQNAINVYVTPNELVSPGGTQALGFAVNSANKKIDERHQNSVVVTLNKDTATTFYETLAHEIGHILLAQPSGDHVAPELGNQAVLLMAFNTKIGEQGAIFQRRRIIQSQVSLMVRNGTKLKLLVPPKK